MKHIVMKLINVLLILDNNNSNTPTSKERITEDNILRVTEDGEVRVTES